jgi:hypothetical protein
MLVPLRFSEDPQHLPALARRERAVHRIETGILGDLRQLGDSRSRHSQYLQ